MGPDQLLNLRWEKRGLLVEPPLDVPWSASHAALPCTEPMGGDRYRLYLSTRDASNRSHIARASLRVAGDRLSVEEFDDEPVLAPGEPGAFDHDGVTMSSVVGQGDRRFLFYTGWTLGTSVPFYLFAGLAVSDDGGATFERATRAPLLERDDVDPILTASPAVLVGDDGWRMWYVSATGWSGEGADAVHHYHVRSAESRDGRSWRRDGRVCLDFERPGEHAFGRPCVVEAEGGYVAWYCVRGERYRLGVARSADGTTWQRCDDRVALATTPGAWDAEMIAYPWVFHHEGTWFLLYNGNGYGKTGIGYAVASPSG